MLPQSILTNIFFGNLNQEFPAAQEKVNTRIHQLLIQEDLLEDIIGMGMATFGWAAKAKIFPAGSVRNWPLPEYCLRNRRSW